MTLDEDKSSEQRQDNRARVFMTRLSLCQSTIPSTARRKSRRSVQMSRRRNRVIE